MRISLKSRRLGAMGKTSDPKSVVDSRARVIGVHGLRVVDASSFALLPPGHPSATICKFSRLVRRYTVDESTEKLTDTTDAFAEKIAADILGS